MNTQTSVVIFAIVHLTTIGTSHVLSHRAWAECFVLLRGKGRPGVFVVAFWSLGFGSIIAAFHPVWSGIPLILTLLGWSQVLKGFLYFSFPAYGLRQLERISTERSKILAVPGVAFLVLSALLLWSVVQ